jgi:DHA1 family multidrug resistance protein-like MFS transporter
MSLNQSAKAIATSWQRTLYIMFFAQMITAIGFSSIFTFLPLYVKSLGSTSNLSVELLAGLVYSGHAVVMMIASPIWGTVADRYGRKLMVERALFGGAVILLLMAFVQTAEQLVLLRMIQGVITGTVAAASALIASIAPRERTGYAMGVLQVGLGAGVALGPIIGGTIADEFSYSAAFYVTSALLLAAGLIVLFFVHEDFKPPTETSTGIMGVLSEWRHILSAAGVKAAYSMRFLSQLGRMMIVPIAPLFIQTLLVETARLNTFTGLVIGVSSATTTVSAVFLGKLGDRIGYRFITIVSSFIAALLYLLQSLATSGWQLLIYQALVGVALGGIIPAISALLAKLTKAGEEGAVYGLDNSIISGGRAIAPLLGAAIAAAFGLRSAFTATAILFFLSSMLAVVSLPKNQVN